MRWKPIESVLFGQLQWACLNLSKIRSFLTDLNRSMLQDFGMFKSLFLCYLFDLAVSELEDCGRLNLELGKSLCHNP